MYKTCFLLMCATLFLLTACSDPADPSDSGVLADAGPTPSDAAMDSGSPPADAGDPPADASADAGAPVPDAGCAAGETMCGAMCVDTSTEEAHCGACDQVCGGPVTAPLDPMPTPLNTVCAAGNCGAVPFTFERMNCDSVCAATTYGGNPMTCTDNCSFAGGTSSWGTGTSRGMALYLDPSTGATTEVDLVCGITPVEAVSMDERLASVHCCCAATF